MLRKQEEMNQECDKSIAKLAAQVKILLKHVMGSEMRSVKVIDMSHWITTFEGAYNRNMMLRGGKMEDLRSSYLKLTVNQYWNKGSYIR